MWCQFNSTVGRHQGSLCTVVSSAATVPEPFLPKHVAIASGLVARGVHLLHMMHNALADVLKLKFPALLMAQLL
jgi:hypothetical protein